MGWGTAAVIASGPSVTQQDVDRLRGKCKVIVVNDCHRLAPWADVLYAADLKWWKHHWEAVKDFKGLKLSTRSARELNKQPQERQDPGDVLGIKVVVGHHIAGLCRTPGEIAYGNNSGYQAIHIAYNYGARRILLLGFDMRRVNGKQHWFGDHPAALNVPNPYEHWVKLFEPLAKDLAGAGAEVINCTPGSALPYWPFKRVHEAI